jgi:hypothetical protein
LEAISTKLSKVMKKKGEGGGNTGFLGIEESFKCGRPSPFIVHFRSGNFVVRPLQLVGIAPCICKRRKKPI